MCLAICIGVSNSWGIICVYWWSYPLHGTTGWHFLWPCLCIDWQWSHWGWQTQPAVTVNTDIFKSSQGSDISWNQFVSLCKVPKSLLSGMRQGSESKACVNSSVYDFIKSINTLRLRQNGRHFPDDIFKWIFVNENAWILVKISLKFVSRGPINTISALVQIMAWRRPGDKPLSEPMIA